MVMMGFVRHDCFQVTQTRKEFLFHQKVDELSQLVKWDQISVKILPSNRVKAYIDFSRRVFVAKKDFYVMPKKN